MAYHFWTKAMPRLSHFRKKTDPEPLEMVVQESDREKIYQFMYLQPQNEITQLIQSLQIDQEDGKSKKAA